MEAAQFFEVERQAVRRWLRVGNMWTWRVSTTTVICVGPDWFFAFITVMLIGSITALYATVLVPTVPEALQPGAAVLPCSLALSYIWLVLSDPGLPRELFSPSASPDSTCVACSVPRLPGREHCDVCGVCIDGYDHHCPFTAKCIGAGNKFAFYLFVTCFYMAVLGLVAWAVCFGEAVRKQNEAKQTAAHSRVLQLFPYC